MVDLEKQEQWRKRIADYEASGQSGASWCKEQGVSECQFWYWKKKFQKETATMKNCCNRWYGCWCRYADGIRRWG